MSHRSLPLDSLTVNRANDRHGELENETAAIAWLFNNNETHMRNLAKDIVASGQVYESPLVSPEGETFVVFDGNRRITCLKLLHNPRRAPTTELQEFFQDLRTKFPSSLPDRIECQVEADRDRLDDILFRRHTGTQAGVGQSTWNDRMKANFVNRTGRGGGINVAEEIEKRLSASALPKVTRKIPWSTMNRLLSAEAFRNRVGFSVNKGRLELTHAEPVVLTAWRRIADDLAHKRIVLGDIWDVDGKRAYLDGLDAEGILPTVKDVLKKPTTPAAATKPLVAHPRPATARPYRRETLIPNTVFAIPWAGRLQRHRAIWEELQFHLRLANHPNAISVLFRVLLELSIDNYVSQTTLATIKQNDKFATRALKVAEDLHSMGKISRRYLEVFRKFPQYDALVSAERCTVMCIRPISHRLLNT
jgi:hypothetical protein